MREVSPIVPRSRIETRPCFVCGVRFKVNARGRKRLYCSKKCENIAYNRHRGQERN